MKAIEERFIEEYNVLKSVLILAIPISLQTLITSSLGIIDSLMIGQLGDSAINSVGFANQIFQIYYFLIISLTSGMSVLISQFWGKKDFFAISHLIKCCSYLGIILTILISIGINLFKNEIISIFTINKDIISTGSIYLNITSFSYLAVLISTIASSTLRSMQKANMPMYIGMFAVGLNSILNYTFIFKFQYGLTGAACATLISRYTETLLLLITSLRIKTTLKIESKKNKQIKYLKILIKSTIPILISEFLWVVGNSIFTMFYGRMSVSDFSAISISYPIQGVCFGLFTGLTSAGQIILGNHIGKNEINKVHFLSKKIISLTITSSIIVSCLILSFRSFYINIYKVPIETVEKANIILLLFAVTFIIRVFNMVVNNGVLRSGGDTFFTLFCNIIGTWCVAIPLGLLSLFLFPKSLYYLYLFLFVGEIIEALLLFYRFKSNKWIKNLIIT